MKYMEKAKSKWQSQLRMDVATLHYWGSSHPLPQSIPNPSDQGGDKAKKDTLSIAEMLRVGKNHGVCAIQYPCYPEYLLKWLHQAVT
jgi:hypothetical protein